jgi:response regulator RpfG family c-di-GMP phosphodiesterase
VRPPRARMVVIVDGNPSITSALLRLLGNQGYSVNTASSGRTALAILRSQVVDGLIVDFRLQDIRGDVLAHTAVALQPRLAGRIVFMAVAGDATVGDAQVDLGCPLVKKPFVLEEIDRVVHETIGKASKGGGAQ